MSSEQGIWQRARLIRAAPRAVVAVIVVVTCAWACSAFLAESPATGGPFTSVHAPFTKSVNFVTGLPNCDAVGPVGMLDDGKAFYLSDWCTGKTYEYTLHSPVTMVASAHNGLTGGLVLDRGRYYGIAGLNQAVVRSRIYAFNPATLTLDGVVASAPCPHIRGLAVDSATGDLYVTGNCGLWRISGVGSRHPLVTHLATANLDGIAIAPGGGTLWVADVSAKSVDELSFTGMLLAVIPIPQGPVGIAAVAINVRSGVAGDLFASNLDGSISMINTRDDDAVSTVASGGYRDEYLSIGPDGYLYAAKGDRIEQIQPNIFGVRDALMTASLAPGETHRGDRPSDPSRHGQASR